VRTFALILAEYFVCDGGLGGLGAELSSVVVRGCTRLGTCIRF
jgi:hypothetical protein